MKLRFAVCTFGEVSAFIVSFLADDLVVG